MRVTLPQVEGKLRIPRPSRVQHGDPNCPHHHHTSIGKHSDASDHPNGLTADHHTATRHGAPS
jgi:hypothetical protein